jgi:hypothetical protein
MHIFIDETGSFSGVGQFPNPSLVGAFVIPDEALAKVKKAYAKVRRDFPVDDKGEVKGRLLSEAQVASVIPFLHQHSTLLFVVGIDLGAHSEAGLKAFQTKQAGGITVNLGPQHQQSLRSQAEQ